MTEKKDTNVKPLFKGMKVDTGEMPEPLPELVERLTELLADAQSGELREMCYCATYYDKSFRRGMHGVPMDFHLMQNNLRVLEDDYFAAVTYPLLSGNFEADEDL